MFKKIASFFNNLFSSSDTNSVNFPFKKEESKLFGSIYTPIIKVKLWSDLSNSWLEVEMVIDTGADYTILPGFIAYELGIDMFKDCRILKMQGVGGVEKVYFHDNVKVMVGPHERNIPVGFMDTDTIPPLMGRHQFIETFQTEFMKNKEIIFK